MYKTHKLEVLAMSLLETFLVTITLTFDHRSSNSIGSEPVQKETVKHNSHQNRFLRLTRILITDRQTHNTQTEKLL